MLDKEKALKEINDHFEDLSVSQFEQNLLECGLGEINLSSDDGWSMYVEEGYRWLEEDMCKMRF